MKITAIGTKNGDAERIDVIDGVVLLNNSIDDGLSIKHLLTEPRSVGGSFWPNPEGMMNIHTNLRFHYFDDEPTMTLEGDFDEEIPYYDDIPDAIY